MSDVLAEVNFAALQQPSGAVVRLDRKFAALVTFSKTASDALSRAGGVFVVLVRVAFLLLLGRGIFLLAACILGKSWKTDEGRKGEQAEEFTCVFHFCSLLRIISLNLLFRKVAWDELPKPRRQQCLRHLASAN
jgi:hypothetical protein